MSILTLAFALIAGLPLLGVVVTASFNALDRAQPVVATRPGLRWLLREWFATVRTLAMHPFGILSRPPRHSPPEWPAEPRPPVVLVPGFALNHSSMWGLARHLRRCGWDWVHVINNEPREATVEQYARELALEIEALQNASGADRVDLVCHSMGGVVAGTYVNQMGGAADVRRLVTLGTPWHGTRLSIFALRRQAHDLAPNSPALPRACPPRVPLTSIWSTHDNIIWPASSSQVDGAHNIRLTHIGHLDLLGNPTSLQAVAEALAMPVAQTEVGA